MKISTDIIDISEYFYAKYDREEKIVLNLVLVIFLFICYHPKIRSEHSCSIFYYIIIRRSAVRGHSSQLFISDLFIHYKLHIKLSEAWFMMRFFKRTAAFILAAAVTLTGTNLTGFGQKIVNAYAGIGEIGDAYWGRTKGYVSSAFSTTDTGNSATTVFLGKEDGKYDDLLCIVRKVTMYTAGTVTGKGSFTGVNSADKSKSGACTNDVRFFYNNAWYNTSDTSVGLGSTPGSDTDTMYIPAGGTVYVCYVINNNSTTAGRNVTWEFNVEITHDKHEGGVATCTRRAVCKYCDQEYGEKAAHVYKNKWVKTADGNCMQKERGYFVYTCTNCSYSYTGSETTNGSLSNHIFSDYQELSDNELINDILTFKKYSDKTCNQSEQYYQKCSVCGITGSNTFRYGDPKGHDYRIISWNWSSDLSRATPLYECADVSCHKDEAGHNSTGNAVNSTVTEKNKTQHYTVKASGTGIYSGETYSDSREKYRVACEVSEGVESIITGTEEGYNYYSEGEQVVVKAIPVASKDKGYYEISEWKSDISSINGKTANPLMFTMPSEPVSLQPITKEARSSGTMYAFNTSDSLARYSGIISLTEGSSLSLCVAHPENTTEFCWQYQTVSETNSDGEPVSYSEWKNLETGDAADCVVGAVSLNMDNSRYRCVLKNLTTKAVADVTEGLHDNPYITLKVIPKSFSSISASYASDSISFGKSIKAEDIILIAKFDNGSSEIIRKNSDIWFIDNMNPLTKSKELKMNNTLGDNSIKIWFDNGDEPNFTNTASLKINVIDDIAPTATIEDCGFDEKPELKISADRTMTYRIKAVASDNFSSDEKIMYRWFNERDELVSTTNTLILTGLNGKYHVTAEDENGNVGGPYFVTVNAWDTEAPIIKNIDCGPDKQWSGYRLLNIEATDNNPELTYAFCGPFRTIEAARSLHAYDDEVVYSQNSSKIIEANGVYCVFAKDIAGNTSKTSDNSIIVIDADNNNGIDRQPPVITSTNRYVTSQAVGVEILASDDRSGICAYAYDKNGDNYISREEWIESSDERYSFDIEEDLKKDTAGRLFAVKDNAGNVTKTTVYVFSQKGPFKNQEESSEWIKNSIGNHCYQIPGDDNNEKKIWLADGESVEIGFPLEILTADTTKSSFLYDKYIWSNENGVESDMTHTTVYENDTYFIEIFGNTGSDENGKMAKELWGRLSFEVNNFDKEKPELTVNELPLDEKTDIHRSCVIKIDTNDEQSGLSSLWIKGGNFTEKTKIKEYNSVASINHESDVKNTTDRVEVCLNGVYEIYVVDSVGNENKQEITVSDLDVLDDSSINFEYSGSHNVTVIGSDKIDAFASLTDNVPGTTVYLTYSAKEGYELAYWESAEVEIYDNCFIMPDCDVTIQAFEREVNESCTYSVNIDCNGHGYVQPIFSDKFAAGDVVHLNYTADDGYELSELSGNAEIKDYSFIMPNEDVNLTARFVKIPVVFNGKEVILPSGSESLSINIDIDGDGIPDVNIDTDGDGNADTNLALLGGNNATNNISSAMSVSSNSIKDGKNEEGQLAFYKNDDIDRLHPFIFSKYNERIGDIYSHSNPTDYEFGDDSVTIINQDTDGDQWPDRNIDIDGDGIADVYVTNAENYCIELESDNELCLVGIAGNNIPYPGDEVHLIYKVPNYRYSLKEWKNSRGISIKSDSFTMPTSNIRIKGCFERIESDESASYPVNISSDKNGVCATYGQTMYYPGETVSLRYSPYPGYTFDEWFSNDVDINGDSFIMPDHEVSITGRFSRDLTKELSVADNETKMTKECVKLSVNLPEGARQQLSKEPFSWDGGVTYTSDLTHTVWENGVYVLTVRLADGSTFKCNPVCVDRIDRMAPTLVAYAYSNNISIYSSDSMSGIGTVNVSGPDDAILRMITDNATDNGLKYGYFFRDGLKDDGTFEVQLKTDTKGEYRISSLDRLGNESTCTVVVDSIPKGEGKVSDSDTGKLHSFVEQYNGSGDHTMKENLPLTEYAIVTMKNSSYEYSGKPIIPKFSVKYKFRQYNNDGSYGKYKTVKLKENVDYTVSFENNTNAGTATLILTGSGDFKGVITKEFTIKRKALSKLKCDKLPNFLYTGESLATEIESMIKIKDKGTVIDSHNYVVSYSDTPIGHPNSETKLSAIITANENGNYYGEFRKSVPIKILSESIGYNDISGADLSINGPSEFVYSGRAVTPKINVTIRGEKLSGKNYILEFKDNINCGTATVRAIGRGRYVGQSKEITFRILPADINDTKVNALSRIAFRDSITDISPRISYKGKLMTEGIDYYAEYEDISDFSLLGLKLKKARIRLIGMGVNFTGNRTITVAVKPRSISSRLTTRIIVSDGEIKDDFDSPQPKVEVFYNDYKLTQGQDYTVKFAGSLMPDRPGKAIITGVGNYSGKRTVKFNIHRTTE